MSTENEWLHLSAKESVAQLAPQGAWTLQNLSEIEERLNKLESIAVPQLILDGAKLEELDTTGAMLILRACRQLGPESATLELVNFTVHQSNLFELVRSRLNLDEHLPPQQTLNWIQHVGSVVYENTKALLDLIAFFGETIYKFKDLIFNPTLLRMKELVNQLEIASLNAIPIISLVSFLIGTVVAYLFATQIEKYGANIFIVDGVSIAMCRELSPMIVAVVMAGRSGSAYTAQIGTMKINEEIDAMETLGLSPIHVLVFPRVFALVLAMPLLVFVGDIVGMLGALIIAKEHLGISPLTFIERLQQVLYPKFFFGGLIKAPVYAATIAMIGCHMGLTVENNARSVGINTTATVVRAIVMVILLNAAFAVLFQHLGM